MDKYINATHLIRNIDAAITKPTGRGNAKSTENMMMRATLGVLKQMVQDEVQSGEVRPVVHAHWIRQFTDFDHNPHSKCSACNRIFVGEESFCCRCGAIMDEPLTNNKRQVWRSCDR